MKKIFNLIFRSCSFSPHISSEIDEETFVSKAADFFPFSQNELSLRFREYKNFSLEKKYVEILGEKKTLSLSESFLILLACELLKPEVIVEIGTQFGKSTRRIIDITQYLHLNSQVICFDIQDEIKYVDHREITLNLHDLTEDFDLQVLYRLKPAFIFLDAHPYYLLQTVITQYLEWSKSNPCILAIHDCSRGLYQRRMKIYPNEPGKISSKSGHWERHVLSKVFYTPEPKIDDLKTVSHHLKIFPTPHGLALISPIRLLEKQT